MQMWTGMDNGLADADVDVGLNQDRVVESGAIDAADLSVWTVNAGAREFNYAITAGQLK